MSLEHEIQQKFQEIANHDIPYGERMILACEVTDMLKAIGLDETQIQDRAERVGIDRLDWQWLLMDGEFPEEDR